MKFSVPGRSWMAVSSLLLLVLGTTATERLTAAGDLPAKSAAQSGRLSVICSTTLFHGVNQAELLSSSKIWLHSIAGHVGWNVDPQVELADNMDAVKKRIEEGSVDLVVSSTLEYLSIARPGLLKPMMTMAAGNGEKGKTKYLLLVSNSSGIARLEDLKGKSITSYSRSDTNLSRMWMDVMLEERHLGPSATYLRSYTDVAKPSSACLPIFFGKSDACLIDDQSWNVLRDLNPQVGGKLKVIAESPAVIENVVAMYSNQKDHQNDIIRGLLGLPDDPEGRQILMFFKCQRVVSIEKQDFDSVLDLRTKYLKSTAAARGR